MQLNAIGVGIELLSSTLFEESNPNMLGYKSVFKGVLNTILVTQNIYSIPNSDCIIEFATLLYKK